MTAEKPPGEQPWRPYLFGLLGSVILMGFALANGYALLFSDSSAYVHRAAVVSDVVLHQNLADRWRDRYEVPDLATAPSVSPSPVGAAAAHARLNHGTTINRSIYYGFLAFAGYVSSQFWLTVFAQAFSVAAPCSIVAFRCLPAGSLASYLTVLLLTSLTTTVSLFVDYLMPDIFAASLILCLAVMAAYWRKLLLPDKIFLVALVSFSALAHNSHLLILIGLLVAGALPALFLRRLRPPTEAVTAMLVCVAVAIGGQVGFAEALRRETGAGPIVLPQLTAHLVQLGPGLRFIKAECPQVGFAICKFEPVLPLYWEDFLSSRDPRHGAFGVADLATKRRLSDEQLPFAIEVTKFDPAGVSLGLLGDGLTQLTRFSPAGMELTPKWLAAYSGLFPIDVWRSVAGSRLAKSDLFFKALTISTYASSILAGFALAAFLVRRRIGSTDGEDDSDLLVFVCMVVLGLVINGLVCGVFASPLGRYQARVIWLAPWLAMTLIAHCIGRERKARLLAASNGGSQHAD